MPRPRLQVTGLREVQAELDAIERRLGDVGPALTAVGQATLERAARAFREQTSPDDGRAWAPLAASTLAISPERRGAPILNATGDLLRSLTFSVAGGKLTFGALSPAARVAQFGKQKVRTLFGHRVARPRRKRGGPPPPPGPGRVPARPYLPLDPAGVHWVTMRALIRDWLITGETRR